MKPWLALIRSDIRLAFRQRVVIFFNYLMPFAFFFMFAQAFHAEQGGAILQVVTMVTVIGILGNGLFGAGMRAAQDRDANILRRFKVAPISPLPLLVASTVTGLVVFLPYVVLMFVLSKMLYGMKVPPNVASVMVFITLGVIAMRSIGLIIASVVNSMQESGILAQVVYMTMLFLSGASFPLSMFPDWLMVATQFIPATWLMTGMQGLLVRHESLAQNWQAVGALVLTAVVGLLLSVKLFRWEKEEKMRPVAKLWVLAVLLPFLALGGYQVWAKDNVRKVKMLDRDLSRSRTALIRNARIFVGNGKVIEYGAVLVRDGRIAEVYDGNIPDPKAVNAAAIEAAGKTILPGLIDAAVNLDASGGVLSNPKDYSPAQGLAAYLYCGVTAVRGPVLSPEVLKARGLIASGERLGAEIIAAPSGTSYPPSLSAAEGATGRADLLNRSLVQQAVSAKLLASTRAKLQPGPMSTIARDNLLNAWKAGEKLIAGSEAGRKLVFHGPTVQRELQLWVEAGIPSAVALRAATLNAAEALGVAGRIGSIAKGKEATLVVVDGNPLQDIKALEAISLVMFKGERVNRGDLLKQD